ncbi:MAG: ribonuclease E inhibitor RraB [Bacteroidetes bacterium]|nr:ribonuclease E inhibitor RraB [Bacteroidota bacterium]
MNDREWAFERIRNDDFSIVRPVLYWFYFTRKEDMDCLIVAAIDLDFTVCSATWWERYGEWSLVLSLEQDVKDETLDRMHELNERMAVRFNGRYDGHEYQVGP